MGEGTCDNHGRSLAEIAQALALDFSSAEPNRQGRLAANDSTYAPVVGSDFFRVCRDTERTQHLTRLGGYCLGKGMDQAGTTAICLAWNTHNEPPLDEPKVIATVASLAGTHRRNHPVIHDPDAPLFDIKAASVARFIGKDVPRRDWVLEDCLPAARPHCS